MLKSFIALYNAINTRDVEAFKKLISDSATIASLANSNPKLDIILAEIKEPGSLQCLFSENFIHVHNASLVSFALSIDKSLKTEKSYSFAESLLHLKTHINDVLNQLSLSDIQSDNVETLFAINDINVQNNTPLHLACFAENIAVFNYFLENKSEGLNQVNLNIETPIDIIIASENQAFIEQAIQSIAEKKISFNLYQHVISDTDDSQAAPELSYLHKAAKAGNTQFIKLLLNIEIANPLYLAGQELKTSYIDLTDRDKIIGNQVIKAKGKTALYLAIEHEQFNAAEFLIHNGCDLFVAKSSQENITAVHLIIQKDNLSLFEAMLSQQTTVESVASHEMLNFDSYPNPAQANLRNYAREHNSVKILDKIEQLIGDREVGPSQPLKFASPVNHSLVIREEEQSEDTEQDMAQTQTPTPWNYNLLLNIYSNVCTVGGGALIVIGIMCANMPSLATGVALLVKGVGLKLANQFGFFAFLNHSNENKDSTNSDKLKFDTIMEM